MNNLQWLLKLAAIIVGMAIIYLVGIRAVALLGFV